MKQYIALYCTCTRALSMVCPVCVLEVQLHCTSHDRLDSNFFIFPRKKNTIALCTVLAVVFGENQTVRIRNAWIEFSWYGKFYTLSLVSWNFPSTKIYSLICTLFRRFKCVFRLSELYNFHFHDMSEKWEYSQRMHHTTIFLWYFQNISIPTLMRVGEFSSLSRYPTNHITCSIVQTEFWTVNSVTQQSTYRRQYTCNIQ